ncbi:TonB-dependent receptor domain-containing protein [Oceanisphaera arctica]|uniref:Vitamin B12 transporter btuB n=1 Tax=Oceanisphaera arctica TaxID=641510 RepID=A0A2P5TIZ1_9GAMM|nr:TonB-dependent receptor [Oceanisphaera arctica]PPL14847.1 vitamin B12 transporter btuB [Oceanisphaera arctica]GHA13211.1 vitamin B12 transporter BtuB [Oceanisphaera arctica]
MSKKWLAATLLPWAAYAQNSSEPTSITIYNRVEQPATSALAPVEVITKAEIERRQPRSLVDLLETLPGMQFGSQSGGIGQLSSLFVRGTNSDHVLVLFNGKPMAEMVAGNVDFSQLPVSNVERIEYIRGPRAAIYGSKAIGGVVNIITTSQVNSAQVGFTTGSNDYYATDVSINQWVTDNTRLQLATGYRETRGYDVKPDNNQPDRDGFESKNLTLGLEHQLNQNWTLDANLNGWQGDIEFDARNDKAWNSDLSEKTAYQADAGIRYANQQRNGQLNISYGESELISWRESEGENSQYKTNTSTAITQVTGLTQYHYTDTGYALAGMDWQRERLLSDSITTKCDAYRLTSPYDCLSSSMVRFDAPDRDNTGVYASVFHTWSPLSVELTGRVDDNEQFGTHGTWQSTLSVDLPEQHKATLSYGTAFKAPSFSQLYWPGSESTELKPEESENWELGLTGDYQVLNWQLSLYRNQIDNLIVYPAPFYLAANSAENTDALIKGVEFVVKTTTGLLHHTASFDYTDAEDIANDKSQLARRAKRKASWTGDIDVADANLFAQVLYVGERNDSAYTDVVLPSYTIWNIGARYPLTQQLTLNGKINNLFDKDYQVVDGYDAPDMEFYVGADYRF